MAGTKSGDNLDKWRSYFRTSSSDIFDIIEHGIMVAASDCPHELRLRRARIAEILFSAKQTKCVGCDRVELCVPGELERDDDGGDGDSDGGDDDSDDDEGRKISGGRELRGGASKESKVDSCRGDHGGEMNDQMNGNYSYGDAEALTDEIEKESQIYEEVLRIKQILENSEDESNSLLIDSLRRLELIALSVEILKATEIGKAVNVLRRHDLKDIRLLARKLIEDWKLLVDEWVNAMAIISGTSKGDTPDSVNPNTTLVIGGASEGDTPDSVNPSSVDEEEGLPSPPLDDFAFFASQPTSLEFSQFFDGVDDDENPGKAAEFIKNRETGRKPPVETHNIPKQRQRLNIESMTPTKDKKSEQTRKQEASINKQTTLQKPNKPSIADCRPGRPTKPCIDHNIRRETTLQHKSENVTIQRPRVSQENNRRGSDEASVQVKLEATKRKLQERYQQAEDAKRQRTIQVMELQDLPRNSLVHRKPNVRPGNNHTRRWGVNGRR